jgi:KUP system potassium uptake protein
MDATMTLHTPALDESTPISGSSQGRLLALAVGSTGVVYGDIGTSPLYALKEAIRAGSGGGPVEAETVYGVLSLIVWALFVIVTLKYVVVMLRADNKGEGGTLTLMALAQSAVGHSVGIVVALGIVGGALFYGDAMITPAISVLSAIEGLHLATPAFDPYVVPISVAILVLLFAGQSRGTARVAAWFGPITVLWFLVLAIGGLDRVIERPEIVGALDPRHGIAFFLSHGSLGFVTLGAVFLAVTGAEALYADLGHFGRRPIVAAWSCLVFPALILNYLGQGALILADPSAAENPFFNLYPDWALPLMIPLAAVATIIASQAVITGTFSLTRQAVQLGLLPRFEIRPTSETERGQIYIPSVNWLLLGAVLILVFAFRSSDALASAYGIAVTGTMVVSALLAFVVVWRVWGWRIGTAACLIAPFLTIDLIFLASNLTKIHEGGWMPLAVGGALVVVMTTWRRGSRLLAEKTRRDDVRLAEFLPILERRGPQRVRGTAVFFTADPDNAPTALLHNMKHNKVIHERNIVLTVATSDQPRVADEDRIEETALSPSFTGLTLHFGYMEEPNVPRALVLARRNGLHFDVMDTSFFLSRRLLRPAARSPMPAWQVRLFVTLYGLANDASLYFRVPSERTVQIGTQIVL